MNRKFLPSLYMRYMLILLLLLFINLCQSFAQINYEEKSTEKIDRDPELIPENNNKQKRLLSIYTKDTKSILYGNPCMDKVTARFGYEYVVMPKNAGALARGVSRLTHNFGVKFLLFFRNPFWKIVSNREAKECRQKTGDYVG